MEHPADATIGRTVFFLIRELCNEKIVIRDALRIQVASFRKENSFCPKSG
jgi:hypothetical protein